MLQNLGVVLVAAALFLLLARGVRMPSIVAFILAGLLLGPVTRFVAVTETIHLITEVGIALLLFLVGLELSFDKIRHLGKVSVVAGLGQVAFTAAGGFLLAWLLGFEPLPAIFIATALTFSSTVVVVKLLDQKREVQSLYGRIAVGIFLVQDLVVILALTMLAGLSRGDAAEELSLGFDLLLAFAGMAALLAAALLASRYVLPRLFGWIARSAEALFIWSLSLCFLFVMGAELMRLSLEIGAFLAGISLAQLPYNHELRRRVHPLMNFFIAVFFVSLGIQMELDAALAHAGAAVALSLFVLIGNPFIFIWIIARLGYGERTSFLTGVTVAQISEFSFIFAAMGLAAGIIDDAVLALIGVVGLVTIAASSYMILYNHQLYGRVRAWGLLRIFRAPQHEDEEDGADPLRDHIIVVGMNSLGRRLVQELADRGHRVLAVDTDRAKLQGLPCRTLLGNVEHRSVLDAANLDEARLVVSALQIEDTNSLLAFRCREAGVPASIHAFDRSVEDELEAIGVSHQIRSKFAGVRRIVEELRAAGLLQP